MENAIASADNRTISVHSGPDVPASHWRCLISILDLKLPHFDRNCLMLPEGRQHFKQQIKTTDSHLDKDGTGLSTNVFLRISELAGSGPIPKKSDLVNFRGPD